MSTMNADTCLTTTRRVSAEATAYGVTGLLARVVVAVAALIAGAER